MLEQKVQEERERRQKKCGSPGTSQVQTTKTNKLKSTIPENKRRDACATETMVEEGGQSSVQEWVQAQADYSADMNTLQKKAQQLILKKQPLIKARAEVGHVKRSLTPDPGGNQDRNRALST